MPLTFDPILREGLILSSKMCSVQSKPFPAVFEDSPGLNDDIELPTHMNPHDKSDNIELSDNSLTVSYKGLGRSDLDSGAVRSNVYIRKACGIFYWEMKVLDKGRDGHIGIGFCSSLASLSRLPGWEKNSFGYHGDDGNRFVGYGDGIPYGPTFTEGDVIGCCLNFIDNTVFFTKNGIRLDVAFHGAFQNRVYVMIGLRTPGESVRVNFGASPFAFDYASYLKEQKQKYYQKVEKYWASNSENLPYVMLSYLIHSGYAKTAEKFATSVGLSLEDFRMAESLEMRQKCKQDIRQGNVPAALAAINSLSQVPSTFRPDTLRVAIFSLKCQQFIELVRHNKVEEAMKYGLEVLRPYEKEEKYRSFLQAVFSILAYKDPKNSPVSSLLEESELDKLGNTVNRAILVSLGFEPKPILEQALLQAIQVRKELIDEDVGGSTFIQVHDPKSP